MATKTSDWKDVIKAQFSKALALALAFMLFAFVATQRSMNTVKKESVSVAETAEAPPDQREEEKPPEQQEIEIEIPSISEDFATGDDVQMENVSLALKQLETEISSTNLNMQNNDTPFDFVPYEDMPEPLTPIKPEYPAFALNAKLQGTVTLEVDVYKNGTVGNVTVKRSVQAGPGGLDEAAVNAVKKVTFSPGKSGGNPVDTRVIIPVEFRL